LTYTAYIAENRTDSNSASCNVSPKLSSNVLTVTRTAAITGPGSRQPASAGGPVFSRVGSLGMQIFFGVSGGVTHGVLWGRGLRGGGLMRSWPECLSMAVRSCGLQVLTK
jgi:hypothetical protein